MFHIPFFNHRNTLFVIIAILFLIPVFSPAELLADDDPVPQTLTSLEQAARTCFQQKDYAGARDKYRQALRDYPDAIRPQCGLIKALLYLQDFTTAQAETEKLLSVYSADPGLIRAVRDVADYYLAVKKHTEAAQYYQVVIDTTSSDSDMVWSLRSLARIRVEQGNFSAAETVVGTLLSDYSNDPGIAAAIRQIAGHYHSAKQYAKAAQLYQTAINSYPEKRDIMCQKGLACSYIRLEDFAAAQSAASKLLSDYSADPGFVRSLRDVADQYLGVKRYTEAAQYYQTVIGMGSNPADMIWSLRGLARIQIEQGNFEAAEATVDKLLSDYSNDPGITTAIQQIAGHYRSAKQYTEAEQLYQIGVGNSSDGVDKMWCQRGLARLQIRQKDFTAADVTTAKLLSDYSSHPEIAKAVREVADCYRDIAKNDNKAIELYQTVISNWPNASDIIWCLRGLACSRIQMGDFAEAETTANKLLSDYSTHPDAVKATRLLADCYRGAGQHAKAIQLYQATESKWSDNADAKWCQFGLACSLIQSENLAAAEPVVGKFLSDYQAQPDSAGKIRQLADRYRKIGHYEDALELYRKNLQPNRNTAEQLLAHAGIACTHVWAGNDTDAQSELELILTNYKDSPQAGLSVYMIGEVYYKKAMESVGKESEDLIRSYHEKAISIWDKNINEVQDAFYRGLAYHSTALSYQYLKNDQESLASYQKYLAECPDGEYTPHALFMIGHLYQKLGRGGNRNLEPVADSDTLPDADFLIDYATSDQIPEVAVLNNLTTEPVEPNMLSIDSTKAAFELLVEKYPDSSGSNYARKWLNKENSK